MYGGNYRRQTPWDARKLWRGPTPVTWTILLFNVVTFFLIAGIPALFLDRSLVFFTERAQAQPWTIVTWPLVGAMPPLTLVFAVGWMYQFGSSLERAWGSSLFARFFVVTVLLSSMTYWVGSFLTGPGVLVGLWAATGPSAVAWAVLNRHETVLLFFLPVPAWAIGALGVVMTWYDAGGSLPGLFALSGCAGAYWYATRGTPLRIVRTGKTPSRFTNFDQEVRGVKVVRPPWQRWQEEKARKERDKRLEEMFRRSGMTDDEESGKR